MPTVPAPALPATLYAEVAGLGADGRGRDVAHLVLLRPRDGLTEDAVLEIAHRFVLADARLAERHGRLIGEVVESAVAPPGGLDWHGLRVPEGTWVAKVRLPDEETVHALASTRRVLLHPVVERDAAKRGDDVDEKTLTRILKAALAPVIDAAARAEVRLKRLEEVLWADPFGEAVRGRGDAGRQVLERLKRQARQIDPVGAAIAERRPPLVPAHPTLEALHDEPDEAPLDPADPFGDAVTRPRPHRRRPVGVSLRAKR
ncbi:MAG: hypothetical protein K6W08_12270 [Firmicutes bacterium]|nr:hypothetical protein [Bacillota bacterium]